jgi:hypothetical protein
MSQKLRQVDKSTTDYFSSAPPGHGSQSAGRFFYLQAFMKLRMIENRKYPTGHKQTAALRTLPV